MRVWIWIGFLASGSLSLAQAQEAPKKRHRVVRYDGLEYLARWDIPKIIQGLDAPGKGSAQDLNDVKDVLEKNQNRTPEQCAQAIAEMDDEPEAFFGAPFNILSQDELHLARKMLYQLRREVNVGVWALKVEHARVRPHLRAGGGSPCEGVPSHYNPGDSFPSGHAAAAYIQALALSEIFPNRKDLLMKRAEEVGQNRIILGVHFPSDVNGGIEVAKRSYAIIKTRKRFAQEAQALRARFAQAGKVVAPASSAAGTAN